MAAYRQLAKSGDKNFISRYGKSDVAIVSYWEWLFLKWNEEGHPLW